MKQVNRFSISDIAAITGIKSATLRIWEQRYNITQAKRTATNIRYYDDFDLRVFLNIACLIESGLKISEIAELSESQRVEKIQALETTQDQSAVIIQQLVAHTLNLNEQQFRLIIQDCIQEFGAEETILHFIYPFLSRIGVLWQTGLIGPAQEHFASSLIKQRLIVAIDELPIPENTNQKNFLLFLPEGEFHEIALLLSQFIVRSKGFPSLYLGQNLPIPYVQEVVHSYQPKYILTVFTADLGLDSLKEKMQKLADSFSDTTILIAGAAVSAHKPKALAHCIPLNEVDDLHRFLDKNLLK